MEPVEAESELMTPTKPAPDGESESRPEPPPAEDEPGVDAEQPGDLPRPVSVTLRIGTQRAAETLTGTPHRWLVMGWAPRLTGAELVLRSPAKDAPPPRQRSVSPDIGPAGDGLGAALLARFGPPVGATSTPTIAPARLGAVAAPWENTPHFSPPRMATDSGEESPVKIDITGILDLLDEPIGIAYFGHVYSRVRVCDGVVPGEHG
ncbi:hypothetical protein FJT64_016965 [Amphibalanus amphitrite]|uniref:Uncharacterized protein n=1 Tax=Amphibalanus amphitrite TaxID=1232801 RepID=A0A6A4X7V3_AMPAM|nr:hypothetical protein FJT64_016965 [Amphibalanus amphitrite]